MRITSSARAASIGQAVYDTVRLTGLLESLSAGESIYFSFVTGLTIGYGDLVPLRFITRVIAILIGFIGILTTGLVAAIDVRALQAVRDERQEPE